MKSCGRLSVRLYSRMAANCASICGVTVSPSRATVWFRLRTTTAGCAAFVAVSRALSVAARARPSRLCALTVGVAVRLIAVDASADGLRLLLQRRPRSAEALRRVLYLPCVEVPDGRRVAPRGLASRVRLALVFRGDVGGRDNVGAHNVALLVDLCGRERRARAREQERAEDGEREEAYSKTRRGAEPLEGSEGGAQHAVARFGKRTSEAWASRWSLHVVGFLARRNFFGVLRVVCLPSPLNSIRLSSLLNFNGPRVRGFRHGSYA